MSLSHLWHGNKELIRHYNNNTISLVSCTTFLEYKNVKKNPEKNIQNIFYGIFKNIKEYLTFLRLVILKYAKLSGSKKFDKPIMSQFSVLEELNI